MQTIVSVKRCEWCGNTIPINEKTPATCAFMDELVLIVPEHPGVPAEEMALWPETVNLEGVTVIHV